MHMRAQKIFVVIFAGLFLTGFSPLKGVKKFTLPNGMRCILKENHDQPIVSVQVWVRVGSVNEDAHTNGISHVFEHMVFKGTEQYPGGEISRTVESNGGIINAATSHEFTFYYIDIPSAALTKALSILSDAMMHCIFPEQELVKERKVILEEFHRSYDRPRTKLYDNLVSELYQQTKYRYTIIGSSVNIASFTRDQIVEWYDTYYIPHNMVLVVVGDFNRKKLKKSIKKLFNAPRSKKIIAIPDLIEPYRESYRIRISSNAIIKQSYLMTGYIGPSWNSKDQYALDTLSVILGSGRSSRLYRNLREKMQIVWTIKAGFYTRTGSGMFTISAECEPQKREAVLNAIQDELDDLKLHPPAESEIIRAKNYLLSNWIFDNETFHQQASNLGLYGVLDRLSFYNKYAKNINKVTVKDIMRVFNRYIKEERKAVSIIVPGR